MLKTAKKVFNATINALWKSEGQESIQTPKNINVIFVLTYKSLTVGFLKLKKGVWTYEYSDEFKNQSDIQLLTDFPDVDKVYESRELLPFFMQRIPSMSQPKVVAEIKKEKIDKTNEVELLKHFGKISITNPFQLSPTF